MTRAIQDEFTGKGTTAQRYYWRHKEKKAASGKIYRKTPQGKRTAVKATRRFYFRTKEERPSTFLLKRIRERCYINKTVCNLEASDLIIPDICPIFLQPLRFGVGQPHKWSPSVDRVDSTKGYVKGNVRVISQKANTVKSDLTIEQVERLLKYMKGEI